VVGIPTLGALRGSNGDRCVGVLDHGSPALGAAPIPTTAGRALRADLETTVTHWVEVVWTREPGEALIWRLVESDTGELCRRWLPSEDFEAVPLDAGGWPRDEYHDAIGFSYGVLWCRAAEGLLGELTCDDIDRARSKLDTAPPSRPRARTKPSYRFEAA